MTFTFDEIVRAVDGDLVGPAIAGDGMRIVTDTRALEAGDAFVALAGEHFDGADFVGDAFAKGATLAIVPRADVVPEGRTGMVVPDTLRAYMLLAEAARMRSSATVVAITGSTGKTTTKTLLAQLLAPWSPKLAATPQNENNEIGVSKLLLALEGDEQHVIIEMGARHPGDIGELVSVAKPAIGILTNIGEAHLEIFGSREVLAETKWGLFSTGAVAMLNVADSESLRRFTSLDKAPAWFGAGDPARLTDKFPAALIPQRDVLVFADGGGSDRYQIATTLPGEHNLSNLAAAIVTARVLGMPARTIVDGIPLLKLPPGRYERVGLPSGVQVIYDAYNASLSGTVATLRAFASENASRRIAILGGMAELGDDSARFHEQAGAAVRRCGIDVLLAGGAFADATMRGALEAGMPAHAILPYNDNKVAAQWLRENLQAGDAVLLKGSRMYKMEEILEALH